MSTRGCSLAMSLRKRRSVAKDVRATISSTTSTSALPIRTGLMPNAGRVAVTRRAANVSHRPARVFIVRGITPGHGRRRVVAIMAAKGRIMSIIDACAS